jgi:outer membrane lipase/esterase
MASQWLRCGRWLGACLAATFLAACGSSTIESQLKPQRMIVFGDAMADAGQNGSRYTINDGTVNIWPQVVSTSLLLDTKPSSTGGLNYATGNARVLNKPDAAGRTATFTVKEQIDAFLAADTFGANDLVLVNAGTSDLIVQGMALVAGAQDRAQMVANASQTGRDLAAQVRRIVEAGGKHVVVVGPYNLSRSPWGQQVVALQEPLSEAAGRFNEQLLVSMVDLGANVLYIDVAFYFNLLTGSPASYALSNVTVPICTSGDPGPGIGTGAGHVNSNLCTTTQLSSDPAQTADVSLFADRIYPTPRGHRLFGDYAYTRIRERW